MVKRPFSCNLATLCSFVGPLALREGALVADYPYNVCALQVHEGVGPLPTTSHHPCFGRFVGSLALHEGALVANYPFDGYVDGSTAIKGVKRPTPDDATFVYLAKLYAALHKTMASSKVGWIGSLSLFIHVILRVFGRTSDSVTMM